MMDYAASLSQDRFTIFLFHGVIRSQSHRVRNYTRKHLEQDYFAAALKSMLAAGGRPASMDDVAAAHQAGEALPPKTFVITFDDGFENNLSVAAPILADLAIPATFYVTTGFIGTNRMSWVDRIEWVIEDAPAASLRLPWAAKPVSFTDAASRKALLDDIRYHVKKDRAFDMDGLATDIQAQLGMAETWDADGELDRKLTWDQVRQLDGHPLFTVGGHSHTHAILSFLPQDNLEEELDTSLNLLHEMAGVSSRHYSYPEGLSHCYSDQVIHELKRRGVVICPSAENGNNDVGTDLFRLRRVMAL